MEIGKSTGEDSKMETKQKTAQRTTQTTVGGLNQGRPLHDRDRKRERSFKGQGEVELLRQCTLMDFKLPKGRKKEKNIIRK